MGRVVLLLYEATVTAHSLRSTTTRSGFTCEKGEGVRLVLDSTIFEGVCEHSSHLRSMRS